jgi:hypothetical protein
MPFCVTDLPRLPRVGSLDQVKRLHLLAVDYQRAPSSYYGLEGLVALQFDDAIHWGWWQLPRDDKGNVK